MPDNATQIFNDNWNIYQKIARCNYMHHKEFGEQLLRALKTVNTNNGISILDIGCGDASQVCQHLRQVNIASYKGYDMSAPALQLAAQNLESIHTSFELLEGNMQSLLTHETKMFDVIYSSFAIHHLQDEEKFLLLQQCYEHLHKDGIMIYIDIFRQDGQSRKAYLDEYFDNIDTNWILLSAGEKQLVRDHVTAYDFPALHRQCLQWLSKIGFGVTQCYQPDKLHGMIMLKK